MKGERKGVWVRWELGCVNWIRRWGGLVCRGLGRIGNASTIGLGEEGNGCEG